MVLVVDTNKRPLNPIHPGKARLLLSKGKAAVFRRYPFTIILRNVVTGPTALHRVKIDPGSKTTGFAVVNEETHRVVWAAELQHRGQQIRDRLLSRRQRRWARRNRKTRYRQPRFLNRRRPDGWLPPSLESRVANITTWVDRLRRYISITDLSMELVKFDTQALQNPEISGVEYQQGTLAGYEVREYLLEKWGRKCAYCGAKNVPFEIEHMRPKSRGGSDRVSNLALACHACNDEKDNTTLQEYAVFKNKDFNGILKQAKSPLKDAAAVNAARWALFRRLQATGLPVECGSGGRTKFNRVRLDLPKSHWIDAACVGASTPNELCADGVAPLQIKATGHGNRQMCQTDKYGFPKAHRMRHRRIGGFRTGDMVRAVVPGGKYAGVHVGRVTVRQRPDWKLNGMWFHRRHFRLLQHADGYVCTQFG